MKVNGKRIKEIRLKKGLRQVRLAIELDLTTRRVRQIENEKSINVNYNYAVVIASFLGVKMADIAG